MEQLIDRKYFFKDFILNKNKDFFDLSEKERESYLLKNMDDFYEEYSDKLMLELFGIKVEKKEDTLENLFYRDEVLTKEQNEIINKELQYLVGIGEDLFYFNEHFEIGVGAASFETLFDFDYAQQSFQEQAKSEEFKDYKVKNYSLYLNYNWVRILNNGNLVYLTLASPTLFVYDEMSKFVSDEINKYIPNKLEMIKSEKNDLSFTSNVAASGKEVEYEKLRKYCYQLKKKSRKEIEKYFEDNHFNKIWLIKDDDKNWFLIFSDVEVIKNIRLRTFIKDIEKYQTADLLILNQIIEEYKVKLGKKIKYYVKSL